MLPLKTPKNQNNGLALMVAAPSVNVPIIDEPDVSSLRMLATVDFGTLSSGAREILLLWQPSFKDGWLPTSIMFGKFYLPYGLLTDEHRTYVRMQSKTSLRDYEMGVSLGWDAPELLHFDLSLTNGFQSAGGFTNADLRYAITPNLRWNPPNLPFMLGASYSRHISEKGVNPYSLSGFGALSLGRLSGGLIKGSILGEYCVSRYWNEATRNERMGFFYSSVDTSGFQQAVSESQSAGYYIETNLTLNQRFTLVYKFDDLRLDLRFSGDSFQRHGAGFNWHLLSNLILMTRLEIAVVHREALKTLLDAKAAQSVGLAMLRLWL